MEKLQIFKQWNLFKRLNKGLVYMPYIKFYVIYYIVIFSSKFG